MCEKDRHPNNFPSFLRLLCDSSMTKPQREAGVFSTKTQSPVLCLVYIFCIFTRTNETSCPSYFVLFVQFPPRTKSSVSRPNFYSSMAAPVALRSPGNNACLIRSRTNSTISHTVQHTTIYQYNPKHRDSNSYLQWADGK